MAFDIDRARRETPGCRNVTHFNNAGAALMPKPVLDTTIEHLRLESEIGGYEAAEAAADKVARVYDAAAELINCRPDEIAFVENATRAWDMAFYSILFRPDDKILTSQWEYASNFIAYLQVVERTGAKVEIIPNDEFGQISVQALANAIGDRVKLIALTHIPTNCGLVNPAEEVGRIAREAKIPYLLDACQSVGHIPVDVEALGCDMLCATGRKFLRGPRGTGLLYVRSEMIEHLEPPFLDLHAARWTAPDAYEIVTDAKRFENWERNYAAKIGLGAAIDYALEWNIPVVSARILDLAELLRSKLTELPGVEVRDPGNRKCGIVAFTVEGRSPGAVRSFFSSRKINVSVSPAEYTLLDMTARGLTDGVVRASVSYYNTEDETDRFTNELRSFIS